MTNTATVSTARELLSFELGRETYGIALRQVQEVRSFERPTRIAHADAWVLGVVDLRGQIVPVADLRVHLGLAAEFDARTVTVVVNVGRHTVGLVVDAVSDVVAIAPDDLQPPPLGDAFDTRCIDGLATIRSDGAAPRLLVVLDAVELLRGLARDDGASIH
jgi:purine-binding chemotaxis protein CheW